MVLEAAPPPMLAYPEFGDRAIQAAPNPTVSKRLRYRTTGTAAITSCVHR